MLLILGVYLHFKYMGLVYILYLPLRIQICPKGVFEGDYHATHSKKAIPNLLFLSRAATLIQDDSIIVKDQGFKDSYSSNLHLGLGNGT